jgi:hypothetical protein
MKHFLLLYYFLSFSLLSVEATPPVRNWTLDCPESIAAMATEMGDFVGGEVSIKKAAEMRRAFLAGLVNPLNAGPIPLSLPFENKEFFAIWNLVKKIQPFYSVDTLGTTGMNGIYPTQSSVTFGSNFIVNRGIPLSQTDTLTDPLPSISFRYESINYDPNTEFIMAASTLAFETLFHYGGIDVWEQSLKQDEEFYATVIEESEKPHWRPLGGKAGFLIRYGAYAYAWNTTWQFYMRNRYEHPEIRTRYWESVYEVFREDKPQLESILVQKLAEQFQLEETFAIALTKSIEESGISDLWNVSPLPVRVPKANHRELWAKIMLPKNQTAQLFFRKVGTELWHYLTISETVGELSHQTLVKPNAMFLKLPSNQLIARGGSFSLEAGLFGETRSRLELNSFKFDSNREHFVGKCHYEEWVPELTRVELSAPLAKEMGLVEN